MRVLITGGAGFIGTHMAERLAAYNDVTLLDVSFDGALRHSPLSAGTRVSRLLADVMDASEIDRAVASSEVVLHCASLIGVQHVSANARRTIDTILLGTRNLLEAVVRHRAGIKRFVYLSTSEVYGEITSADENARASVGCGNDARLSYASAKLAAEHIVWAYHRDFDLPTVIVRPFNIYGPYRTASHAVGIFAVRALSNDPIEVHGDGSQLRSWCYVDDFCEALLACLVKPEAIGRHFNIGNPIASLTIYELAHRIKELSGSTSTISSVPRGFTDIDSRAPHPGNARRLLGFAPKHDITSGLRRTIAWYRENLNEFSEWR